MIGCVVAVLTDFSIGGLQHSDTVAIDDTSERGMPRGASVVTKNERLRLKGADELLTQAAPPLPFARADRTN